MPPIAALVAKLSYLSNISGEANALTSSNRSNSGHSGHFKRSHATVSRLDAIHWATHSLHMVTGCVQDAVIFRGISEILLSSLQTEHISVISRSHPSTSTNLFSTVRVTLKSRVLPTRTRARSRRSFPWLRSRISSFCTGILFRPVTATERTSRLSHCLRERTWVQSRRSSSG